MSFDKIIANAPFDKNLHLKILREAMKHIEKEGGELVNLSPTRWLQDPLADVKSSSDFKRFPDIYARIADIEVIDKNEANDLFGIDLTSDLGIYIINEKGGWKRQENVLVKKLLNGMKDGCMADHLTKEPKGKYVLKFREGVSTETHTPEDKKYYCVLDSYESATKITGKGHTVYFNADNEDIIRNAHQTYTGKFMRTWNKIVCFGGTFYKYMPYLDFSRTWTDADLYEYFNLTPEERKIIEEEMKMKH